MKRKKPNHKTLQPSNPQTLKPSNPIQPSLLIIGLGNPGTEYAATRHNVGWWATEKLVEAFGKGVWHGKEKLLAELCEGIIGTVPLLLAKPSTFMNESGNAVRAIIDFYKLDPAQKLIIICDDVDLPVGELRFRKEGGSGSHNGLKSVVAHIGENFARIRIGIRGAHAPAGSFRQTGEDLASYVLSQPAGDERKMIDEAIGKIPEMVREFVEGEKN